VTTGDVLGGTPCQPTRLSEEEAASLVLNTEHVLRDIKAGMHISYVSYAPVTGNTNRFFYFQLNGDCEAADGCLLGFWAVDKVTGRVIDERLSNDEGGPALVAAQRMLRIRHCVDSALVMEGADLVP
jgi:hypothetical protein